ncbi:MAG: hypothetical protein RL839_08835 [Gammaproteobacteria bacterium]
MPLTTIQQFFYFLVVAGLYGSPLIFVILYLSWRKKSIAKGFVVIAVCLVLGAGLLQSSFRLSTMREANNYNREQGALSDYAGNISGTSTYAGAYVGLETIGSLEYSVYQFAALDGSDRWLRVLVPPPGIGAAAFLRHDSESQSELEPARLVVWTDAISLNPSLAPVDFFEQFVPGEAAHEFGRHTIMVNFRARRSTIVHPGEAGADRWLWRDGVNEL